MPFKANQDRRHHIPKQRRRVTNWAEYDAALRQRGSLTVWVTEAAIAAWRAAPRRTPGRASTLFGVGDHDRADLAFRVPSGAAPDRGADRVHHPAARLALAVPDHSTLSRRAETLQVFPRPRWGTEPAHLLVDSTGLKLCGPGEWLVEKHGTRTRRSWRKLHIGVDAGTGQIMATELTTNDIDDGSQVSPLLDQVTGPIASLTGDGAYDRDDVYRAVADRHPEAAVVVPPRATAVPSETANTAPTQRDRHLQQIAERGRMGGRRTAATIGAPWSKRRSVGISE